MDSEYLTTIGLEIHAELNTTTKMFCDSRNDALETRPNHNVCPVCMGHPGTLPVINSDAVARMIKIGTALGGKIADYTEFDRKNYFYPDLPKGYQISQFEYPLVSGGSLGGIAITRVHLEEDTASSVHNEVTGETAVDFNRSGVPLMELVTQPVMHSADEAVNFGKELQLLLRYLNVSNADMEKGQMRLEANVSVSNTSQLGTKVEIKNINSFRAMERAVLFEIARQTKELKSGKKISQETRGWDEARQATFPQRSKEGSADYRYFPDPDLPSLRITELARNASDFRVDSLPTLPWEKRERYTHLGFKSDDIEMFIRDSRLGDFLDSVIERLNGDVSRVQLAANYIANDLANLLRKDDENANAHMPVKLAPHHFANLIHMLADKKISSRAGKDILAEIFENNADPDTVARDKDLFQTVTRIEDTVKEVIGKNQAVVDDFKRGKSAALEFLVGQCMKILRGAADPVTLRTALRENIEQSTNS